MSDFTNTGYLIGSLMDWNDQQTCTGLRYWDASDQSGTIISNDASSWYLSSNDTKIYYAYGTEDTGTHIAAMDTSTKQSEDIYTASAYISRGLVLLAADQDSTAVSLTQESLSGPTHELFLLNNQNEDPISTQMITSMVFWNGSLYYAEQYSDTNETKLCVYDPNTKKSTVLMDHQQSDGSFEQLIVDHDILYVVLENYSGNAAVGGTLYEYQTDTKDLHQVVNMSGKMNRVSIGGSKLSYASNQGTYTAVTNYKLYDLQAGTSISYDGGAVKCSDAGMIWQRYNVDTASLSKLALKPDDISYMYMQN